MPTQHGYRSSESFSSACIPRGLQARILALALVALPTACTQAGMATPRDAQAERRDAHLPARDVGPADATWCGTSICSPSQYCKVWNPGTQDATFYYICNPIPASCGGVLTCLCLGYTYDACGGFDCCSISGKVVTVNGF